MKFCLGLPATQRASTGFGEYAVTFVEENKPQYYSPRLMLLKLNALMPNNFYIKVYVLCTGKITVVMHQFRMKLTF